MDNIGQRLLVGGPEESPGTIRMRSAGGVAFQRWTWALLGNGDVAQIGATTTDGGATFGTPFWNSVYRPRP